MRSQSCPPPRGLRDTVDLDAYEAEEQMKGLQHHSWYQPSGEDGDVKYLLILLYPLPQKNKRIFGILNNTQHQKIADVFSVSIFFCRVMWSELRSMLWRREGKMGRPVSSMKSHCHKQILSCSFSMPKMSDIKHQELSGSCSNVQFF